MLSPRETPKLDVPGDLLGERRIQNRKSRGKFLLSATSYRGFQKAELCLLGEGEEIKIPGWELLPLVPWDEPREFGAHSLAEVSHFPGAGWMWLAVCRCRAGCGRGRDAVSALRERSLRPEHLPGNYGTGPPSSHSLPWAPATLPSAWPLPKASLSSPLPRSAALFKLSPSELPPHPRRWLRDGAAEERSCHVNFPLFFRAPRTDRLPSNFCGNYMRRSSLCKTYIFSCLRKLRGALGNINYAAALYLSARPSPALSIAETQTCCIWSQRKLDAAALPAASQSSAFRAPVPIFDQRL